VYFKICGIKEIKTINCCIRNKVKFFGLLFYKKSPRNISLDKASKLISFVKNKDINPVGVFVNEELDSIINKIKKLKLRYIQLHGNESNRYIFKLKNTFKVKIIKSISISSSKDLNKIKKYADVDYFLFDYKAKRKELPGGNAKSFDWKIIKNLKIKKPWFISGGINASNIRIIKEFVNPDGIDLSSGVEEIPGVKNNKMIDALFERYNE
tara:strand:- start:766 stop:1395 length:630 start_codon:yes stop_codon:yes gene_type:complete